MSGGVPKRVLISKTQSNTPSKAGRWGKPGIILCNGARSRRAMCNSIQTRAKYCPTPCKPKSGSDGPAGPALTPTATMTSASFPGDNLIGFSNGNYGALVPNNIVSPNFTPPAGNLTIESIKYIDTADVANGRPVFTLEIKYPDLAPIGVSSDITSITVINCDNGSVMTYNTNDLGSNPGGDGDYQTVPSTGGENDTAQWNWVSSTSTELLQEQAFWRATGGKSIKIIIEFTGGPTLSKTVSDYCVNAPTYTPPTLAGPITFDFGNDVVSGPAGGPAAAQAASSSGEIMAGNPGPGGAPIGTISPLPASLPGNELRQIDANSNNIRYTYDYSATPPNFNLYITASNGLGPTPASQIFGPSPFSSIKFTITTGSNPGTLTLSINDFDTVIPSDGPPYVSVIKQVSEEVGGEFETFWKNAYEQTVSIEVTVLPP